MQLKFAVIFANSVRWKGLAQGFAVTHKKPALAAMPERANGLLISENLVQLAW